jgi:nicotinamide mononucleotide adenylyltransferase
LLAHYSVIETRMVSRSEEVEVYDYKSLSSGDVVGLEWETPGQDGYAYRAVSVREDEVD